MRAPFLSALAALVLFGCTRTLPRSEMPARAVPAVDTSRPVPAGHGRLIVDVPEQSSSVSRVALRPQQLPGSERWSFDEEFTLACEATPCLLDVPVGNVLLSFPVLNREDQMSLPELIHIGTEPTVFRRSLDVYEPGRPGLLYTGVIGALLSIGGILAGALVLSNDQTVAGDRRSLAGAITLGSSVAVFALSIWMTRRGAATLRPGSSIHFPLE